MLKEIEIERLKKFSEGLIKGVDADPKTFDFEYEIDRELDYEENKNLLKEKIGLLYPNKNIEIESDEFVSKEMINFKQRYLSDKDPLSKDILEKFKTIAIYGTTGSGKTALAFKVLEKFNDRPIFFIKHPNPSLIKKYGYANLNNLHEIEKLHDCVLYYDEPQLSTSIYDHHSNIIISRICSLARQRNIKLILSSSDTRVFGKGNEAYFDLWIVKDTDFYMCKNGSMIKKIIKDNSILDPEGFRLEVNEYLFYSRITPELNGKFEFTPAKIWNNDLSMAYKNSQLNSQRNSE